MKHLLATLFFVVATVFAFAQANFSEHTAESGFVRIDARTSTGGRLLRGTERISPMAESADANARLTVDGVAASGWNVKAPEFDAAALEDGWHNFVLNEGATTAEARLLVLNDAGIAVHGGALSKNERWGAGKIHVVRNWVRIPAGVTLTVETGAIVKFCEATGIQNDGSLVATGAVFTSIEDDTAGGDTDQNGDSGVLGYGVYAFTGNGLRTMTNCEVRCAANLPVDTTWAAGSVNHVFGTLTVGSGVTLTIEPGAVVKFASGAELQASGGSIVADGALFTHLADDSEAAGGDTNGDGDATSPVSDVYKLTGFTPGSNCELRYITLTFAGGTIFGTKILQGNRVHKVTGNITVASGGKLVVQPGAIVKMSPNLSITVKSGGTLEALGTKAQPIVFTSIKDDAHGRDTNGDGKKTEPQPGDWGQITVNGTANMEYCRILYPAGANNQGGIYISGGNVNFCNGEISHTVYDCVRSYGTSTFSNTVFSDSSMGFAPASGNNIVKNCVFYNITTMVRWSYGKFYNCIFMNGNEFIDSKFYSSTVNMPMTNCVFWNPADFGGQTSCPKVGSNGNLWADPLFNDPENGDFTLKATSPCIDAGDGSVAPELDYFGQPRQDLREVADTGTAGANGCVPDIGIHEALPKNVASAVDLVAVSVESAQNSALVGEGLAVSWTLRNDGSEAAVGSWRDYLYLVGADGTEVSLGSLATTGSIAPNGLRVLRATFAVPDVNEGEYRLRVKANLNRDIYEGTLTANNLAVSEATVAISYPKAKVKDGLAGQLRPGEEAVRLVAVEDGYSLALIHAPKGTRVYYSLGTIPTAEMYISGVTCLDGETMLSLPTGEVYLLVVAPEDEACDYDIDFAEDGLKIHSVSQSKIPATGKCFVRVHGACFATDAVVRLVSGSKMLEVQTYVPDDNDIWIEVDGEELTPGYYDLEVLSVGEKATLANAFLATGETGVMGLVHNVVQPASARVGRVFTATLEFENTGDVALPAPIFVLDAPYREFVVNGEICEKSVSLYGIGAEYPYGFLLPGEKQKIIFQMKITSNSDYGLSCRAYYAGTEGALAAVNLEEFYSSEYLEYLQEQEPEEYASLRKSVGATWEEFYTGMAEYVAKELAMSFAARQLSFAMAYPILYEFVREPYLANISSHLPPDDEDVIADNGVEFEEIRSCSLPSGSELISGKEWKKINSPMAGGSYSAFPMYLSWLKGWSNDYRSDSSFPGQIWWYHSSCKGWHRIGLNDQLFTAVKEAISAQDKQNWYLICHGNENSIHEPWIKDMASKIHSEQSNANIFAVDWGDIAEETIFGWRPEFTALSIPQVALIATGQLEVIQRLCSLETSKLTIIGHSHGVHLGGEIAQHLSGQPKRLVALDASPMWTHESASTHYPDAWNNSVAAQVEFYKTSWGFSMGSEENDEAFGVPNFFVVKDIFDRDLFERMYNPKGFWDGIGESFDRHTYAHKWFRGSFANSSDLGWNWTSSSWSNSAFGKQTVGKGRFHGVIGTNGNMELGKKCVDNINSSRRDGHSEITRDTWRYDSLVLNGQCDSLLGLNGLEGLERLWNLWSMLVEYRANYLTVNGVSKDCSTYAGRNLNIEFSITNMADNQSINKARSRAHFNGTDWDKRYSSVVPWDFKINNLDCQIANTVRVYDLHELASSDLEKLISEVEKNNFSSAILQNARETGENVLLSAATGYSNFIKAGATKTVRYNAKLSHEMFSRRTWELGRKPNGEVYDAEKGEPFLVVGTAAALKIADTYPHLSNYQGDLFLDDNLWATIIYVKPANGELEARLVASNELRGAGESEMRGADDGFVQQQVFEVTTAEDGSWSLAFSAAQSICTNGLDHYYWETKDFYPQSGETTEPYLVAEGELEEDFSTASYQLSLTVCDVLGETDTVEVTIKVRRPEKKCMGCTKETCFCGPGCTCEGCKEWPNPPVPDKPQSCDPNEMAGVYGFGDAATQRFVQPGEEMTYTIYFENKADATAAAQEVRVTQELSKWLDWNSFQISEVGFRNQIDAGLAGKSDGSSEVALEGTAWKVRTEVEFNRKRGVVSYYLRIVDETTADGWPESAYDGFLPPNDDNHSGEGYIRYKVKVREDAPEGARIDAAATIVFDYNEPITTSPAWFNWVGAEGTFAATGYMTWDAVDGATYEVSVWSGDPDPAAEAAVAVTTSGELTQNRWRLPSGLKDGVTYFWQVVTTDAKGKATPGLVYSFELGGRVTYELSSGWNLLSLPFEPDAYSRRLMLGRALFVVEDESFVRPLDLEMGRAYWLYNGPGDEPYLDFFPTETLRAGEKELSLEGQWTMAGTPDGGTDLADYPEVMKVFEWKDGRYQLSDGVLAPGKGYWLGTGANTGAKYLVVDLSGGATAKSFPVRYTDEGPDLSDDTCRTTELWLRWVPAGSFAMGSDPGVPGRNSEREMPRHNVTLTRGYYVGVFECTQRQWEQVMGNQISNMRIGAYAPVRPVGMVSYELLRGSSDWPRDGHAVDEASFMGRIRAKTGLLFDLPTEAQWEYACRARTTTGLNSGVELTTPYQADPAMDALGRYLHNGGGVTDGYQTSAAVATAPVGSYQPNAWGLYDMHGNLWEWCLDWWQPNAVGDTMADAVDPVGPVASTGNGRVLRGGGFTNYAAVCRSAYQFNKEPSYGAGNLGFRLFCLPQ